MQRRRFLVLAGSVAGLAGCSSGGDTPVTTATDTGSGTPTATNTETRTTTDTKTRTAPDAETTTETRTASEAESAPETGSTTGDETATETETASQTATPASEGSITFDEDGHSTSNGYEVDTTVTNNNDHDVTVALDVRLLDENGGAVADKHKERVVTANNTWEETFTFDQSGEGHEVEFTVSE